MERWRDRNPLRAYRKSKGLTIPAVCTRLGVGTTTLQKWEGGTATPTPENMKKLSKMMSTANAKLITEWESWLEEARR
jgi:transcriptional regulator with XRE-family HTH domain